MNSIACLSGTWAVALSAALALAACGTTPPPAGTLEADVGGGTDATAPTDSAAADVAQVDGGADATVAADTPVANDKCGKYDDGTYGKKVPWEGFTHKGKTYNCNTCRGGYPNLVGGWRLVDFETEDPTVDLGGDKERLSFDGNTFEMRMYGKDQGKVVDAVARGWFFCADGAELANQRAIFIFDSVAPEGAFGWSSGHVTSAETLTQGTNKLAFGFNDDFDAKLPGYFTYCKIGSLVDGKPCDDPFK